MSASPRRAEKMKTSQNEVFVQKSATQAIAGIQFANYNSSYSKNMSLIA